MLGIVSNICILNLQNKDDIPIHNGNSLEKLLPLALINNCYSHFLFKKKLIIYILSIMMVLHESCTATHGQFCLMYFRKHFIKLEKTCQNDQKISIILCGKGTKFRYYFIFLKKYKILVYIYI